VITFRGRDTLTGCPSPRPFEVFSRSSIHHYARLLCFGFLPSNEPMSCPHPQCEEVLQGIMHFKNHATIVQNCFLFATSGLKSIGFSMPSLGVAHLHRRLYKVPATELSSSLSPLQLAVVRPVCSGFQQGRAPTNEMSGGANVCADGPKTLVTAPHLIGYQKKIWPFL
jgi:hypothetical protein